MKNIILTILLSFFACAGLSAQVLHPVADKKGKLYGFANDDGVVVVKERYTSVEPFSNGVAKVEKNGKFGLINTSGREILPLKYTEIMSFDQNGIARVKKGNKMGLVNKNGSILLDVKYGAIGRFNSHGLTWFNTAGVDKKSQKHIKGKMGVIDTHGRILIPAQYKYLSEFAAVEDGTSRYFNSRTGFRPEIRYYSPNDTLFTDCTFMWYSNKFSAKSIYKVLALDNGTLLPLTTNLSVGVIDMNNHKNNDTAESLYSCVEAG